MTPDQAKNILKSGGELSRLAEAIGIVISSPQSTHGDLLLGLRYGGFVAEQAAIALYRRTGRQLPEDRSQFSTDVAQWLEWLEDPDV